LICRFRFKFLRLQFGRQDNTFLTYSFISGELIVKRKERHNLKRQLGQFDYSQLESRQLLAGDVQVTFVNGHLQLIGDHLANSVKVEVLEGDNIRVTGSNTTFNGDQTVVNFQGAVSRFTANLGAGNDALFVYGLKASKDIIIEGGTGNDTVRLRDVEARDINIDLGVGNDTIDIDGAKANKNAILRVTNGINLMAINNLETARELYLFGSGETSTTYVVTGNLHIGRDVWALFGAGHDRVWITGETSIGRNATFWMGLGNDIFAGVPERTGKHAQINGHITVQGGGNDDLICLDEHFEAAAGAYVFGGGGRNSLLDSLFQCQYSKIQSFTDAQPNRPFGVTMDLLEMRGIDYVIYGGVKLNVDPNTFRIWVTDASPTVSSLWSTVAQDAVRIARSGPTIAARVYGMVHTAMYDAWSAYDPQAQSTLMGDQLQRPASENTVRNKTRAMSYAAYRVLVDLYPAQKTLFDQTMMGLGFSPTNNSLNPATPTGIGNLMAKKLLEYRHQDGSNQLGNHPNGAPNVPYSDTIGYVPTNTEGNLVDIERWTPERIPITNPTGPIQSFLTPHWGNVTPFGITSITDFRAPTPEPFLLVQGATVNYQAKTITLSNGTVLPINKSLIGTVINPKFVQQFEEIVDISANLTDEQKLIAEFWENGGNTPFPPGTWLAVGQYVSARDNHSLDQDAKLFFALGNAVMNAGIATWETKLHYDYARPVRAIRDLGALGLIGEFDATLGGYAIDSWVPGMGTQRILATDWLTYQPLNSHPSPPFPDYTSGHSSFSASAAEVLKQFTGSDFFNAKATFLPGSSRVQPGIVPSQTVTLSWNTFSQASLEAGDSRMYGGIHFRDANVNGIALGKQVGQATWDAVQKYFAGIA
jgi:hypothetical protein